MNAELFTAKVLGLYLLIMGIAMLLKAKSMKVVLHEIISSPPLIFVSGAVTLIVGLLLLTNYNSWEVNWLLTITLLGWIITIRSILCLFFPILAVHLMKKLLHNDALYFSTTVVITCLGIILSYMGFMTAV